MNEECLKAQQLIHHLQFDEAEKILKAQKEIHPDNIALPWMQESIIFLKLFISEDPDLYKSTASEWGKIISSTQKLSFNNAWYRFILSDMHIHRGLIRLKFNDHISAGADIQSAYRYLKDNRKMFPSFLPDNKNFGFLSCAFSSVPSKYQWLARLIGFQGDMKTGLSEMEAYLNSDLTYKENVLLRTETAFIYAMVQHHLNRNTPVAWNIIEPYTRNYKTNLLENYMRATIAGYQGLNDDMIHILESRPSFSTAYPFYYMDFLLGLAKMRRLDDDADVYFRIFTVRYKGRNYVKSAYRNLSWLCQAKGDESGAKTYYSLCLKNGSAVIEEDRQAERESKENLCWPSELIRARMLFDGKYFDRSLKILKGVKEKNLLHTRFVLELYYRKARIHHEKGNTDEALTHYLLTIEKGKKQPYYFAAYSALYIAYIYEGNGNKKEAEKYFRMAKGDFPDNREYENSIEHKAKAGLKRIGK